jgi:predicted RNA binding protein YcfA (HicA-like mRNA interferase family)
VTALERSIARLLVRPPEADFSDVRRVLEAFGWTAARQRDSHLSFTKPGERTISIPIHGRMVKRIYVDQICERLGLEDES